MLACMDTPQGTTKLGTLLGIDLFAGTTDAEQLRQLRLSVLKAFNFTYVAAAGDVPAHIEQVGPDTLAAPSA